MLDVLRSLILPPAAAILTILLIALFFRLCVVSFRYFNTYKHISPSIHRHHQILPITSFFDTEYGRYEDLFKGLFDTEGIPYPAVNMGPHIDGTAFMAVTDPEAIRDVLFHEEVFLKMPPTYALTEQLIGHGIVTQKGEEWRRNRKIITPLFNYKSLKLQFPVMVSIASQMVEMLKQSDPSTELSAHFIRNWTMKVLVAIAFGNSFDNEWLAKIFRDLLKAFNGIAITTTVFGALSPLVGFYFHHKMNRVRGAIEDQIKRAVKKRRKELKEQKQNAGRTPSQKTEKEEKDESVDSKEEKKTKGVEDLITLLLLSGVDFPEKALMDQGLTFLFAGFETTSLLLQWTMYFLADHPDVQQKIRLEVSSVLEGSETLDASHLSKLVYTKAVLQESLRLRPPVPFLDRLSLDHHDLPGNIHVPKDTSVMIFFHATNLDPRIWKDPLLFLPERFLQKEEQQNKRFMPFSAGDRNCLGQKVAMQEATIFLATLMHHFELRSKDTSRVRMVNNPLLEPHNLFLSFHPLPSSHSS